jgi:hypothetical protein
MEWALLFDRSGDHDVTIEEIETALSDQRDD